MPSTDAPDFAQPLLGLAQQQQVAVSTNTAVTIGVQHNGTAVGTEASIDFEDATGFVWLVIDDSGNTRIKITPPAFVVASGGNLQDTQTFTITAPQAGTYCLEFGAGSIDTVSTGTQLKLTSGSGGEADYSDTSGGGGSALVPGLSLSASQVITITCTKVSGSALGTLKGCWAKLTQTA